jgi:hypothetical protein
VAVRLPLAVTLSLAVAELELVGVLVFVELPVSEELCSERGLNNTAVNKYCEQEELVHCPEEPRNRTRRVGGSGGPFKQGARDVEVGNHATKAGLHPAQADAALTPQLS